MIPNPKHDKVPTHNAQVELERKGFVIHKFPFDKGWDATMLKTKIEEQFPQLEWRLVEFIEGKNNIYGEEIELRANQAED